MRDIRREKEIMMFLIFSLVIFVGSASGGPENYNYDKLYDYVETPHVKWAKPYYQGEIKCLVIASLGSQRETVELAQRLSLKYTPFMIISRYDNKTMPEKEVLYLLEQKLKQTWKL